jgi:hypothetical protein
VLVLASRFSGSWIAAVVIVGAIGIATNADAQSVGLAVEKLPGIVVDDASAELSGTWSKSTHTSPFVGQGYIYSAGGSEHIARFNVDVAEAGEYHLLVAYTPGANRTEAAQLELVRADDKRPFTVNQQQRPSGPFNFHSLGQFSFEPGPAYLAISGTPDTKGVVIADALALVTTAQLEELKQEAEKAKSPLLVALKKGSDPTSPAAAAKKADDKEKPPVVVDKTPTFQRKQTSREVTQLTPDQLDELLEKYVGGVTDAPMNDDEAYLRRLTLDLIGRQPTPAEMGDFAAEAANDKRSRAVEKLLAMPEFGQNWANYYSDVISYRTPQPELTFLNYSPFKAWLAGEFNANSAWDDICYRIITATGKVGDNPAATFIGFHQADKSRLASETTRVFLSTQIACAECHDHKFIDLPQETFHHVAAFFVRTQAKLPWNDSSLIEVSSKASGEHKMPEGKKEMEPIAFSERRVELGQSDIARRVELADWVIGPDNPWFAKAFVNRTWARMMGRGFCEPVDEIGELGDRVLPEMHTALADHFVSSKYDIKEVFRLIANSRCYQRSISDAENPETKPFAYVAAGRLRGDEVFDSLAAGIGLPNVTPPTDQATAAIRFPPPPKSTRDLVNEAFGFDPSSEASNVARTMQQAMFLMNNKQVQLQVDASPGAETMLARLVASQANDEAAVKQLYQNVLARKASADEVQAACDHIATLGDRKLAYEDLLWSMINSAEFLSRR